jgi:hypothetical protein
VATATATAAATSTDDLLLFLAGRGEATLAEAAAAGVGDATLAIAWARGEIEIGRTKYVVTGNPATGVTVHNSVNLPPASVVVEGGLEWSGPKQKWHAPLAKVLEEKLPTAPRYQRYCRECCVNAEKDVWEWLEDGATASEGREVRWARRNCTRADAEKLFELRVRLTDKGQAALCE